MPAYYVYGHTLNEAVASGTGAIQIGDAVAPHLSIPTADGITDGMTVGYAFYGHTVDSNGLLVPTVYERGRGTYNTGSPQTITRNDPVWSTSGLATAVNLSADTPLLVWLQYMPEDIPLLTSLGAIDLPQLGSTPGAPGSGRSLIYPRAGAWYERHGTGAERLLYSQANILGTVSQSSGSPTGAIIQRGSNANGSYVRYADGTQICWHRVDLGSRIAAGSGTLAIPYRTISVDWTFPVAFNGVPSFTGLGEIPSAIPAVRLNSISAHTVYSGIVTAVNAGMLSSDDTDVDVTANLTALGRWY